MVGRCGCSFLSFVDVEKQDMSVNWVIAVIPVAISW